MLNCSALHLYCLCRGRVYEARRGGELPEPASDRMCSLRWRQPGMLYILQRACSISGLLVWQLDHINLIFKLQRSHSHGSVHVVSGVHVTCTVRHACREDAWRCQGGVSNNWQRRAACQRARPSCLSAVPLSKVAVRTLERATINAP